jgi:hypothetical protein
LNLVLEKIGNDKIYGKTFTKYNAFIDCNLIKTTSHYLFLITFILVGDRPPIADITHLESSDRGLHWRGDDSDFPSLTIEQQ